jgi:7-keto-8-aminopelargonate synthetase-like enzyme
MISKNESVKLIQTMVDKGIHHNIVQQKTDLGKMNPGFISMNGEAFANFGSCSYLGLEFDKRLQEGSIEAIHQYGTQFSSSRAYVSIGLYDVLEKKLQQMFDAYPVIAPTTSLGHIAALPILVNSDDIVLLDHQVHNSVNTAAKILKSQDVKVELIRHNRMDILEEKIKTYSKQYNRVWYLADGIYSMYGDSADVKRLKELLDEYASFHVYIDDAHGMSCFGKNGTGHVMSFGELHPKMVLAVSFAKAFATGGAALLFANKNWAHAVRSCGGPMLTSGPLQPAQLGAAIACADIHLSPEIKDLQLDLLDKIKYTEFMINRSGLFLIKDNTSPIFFVGTSAPDAAFKIVDRMKQAGYYMNVSAFPVVPMKNAGVRFTITRLNDFKEIDSMIRKLHEVYFEVLREEGLYLSQIYKAFNKVPPATNVPVEKVNAQLKNEHKIKLDHFESINEIDKEFWNNLFKDKGTFDYNGLKTLENVFTKAEKPESKWDFDYIVIKDEKNKPVLATYFTTSLVKDDMLSDKLTSEITETLREKNNDPFYMTSRVTMMGCLLSEGEQIYLNPIHPQMNAAIDLLIKYINVIQQERKSQTIMLRDFDEKYDFLKKTGVKFDYIEKPLPSTFEVDLTKINDMTEYLESLEIESIDFPENEFKLKSDLFDFNYDKSSPAPEIWEQLHLDLIKNDKEVNVFPLPLTFFEQVKSNPNWDVINVFHKDNKNEIICSVFSYLKNGKYNVTLIGLDCNYPAFEPALIQCFIRSHELKCTQLNLGFGAAAVKQQLGATGTNKFSLIQTSDTFNYEYLEMVKKNSNNKA